MQTFFRRLQRQVQIRDHQTLRAQVLADPRTDSLNERVAQALGSRSQGIKEHFLAVKPEDYSKERDLRVIVTTFNANGSSPTPNEDLRSWLLPDVPWPAREPDLDNWDGPDILIIALQEVNALNAVNVVAGGDERTVGEWQAAVACALNETELPAALESAQAVLDGLSHFTGEDSSLSGGTQQKLGFGVKQIKHAREDHQHYQLVGGRRMIGVYISVWARSTLVPHISSWEATDVRTGNLGFGNKGCVAVRLRVWDEPLCVICAHLASGQTQADALRRRADYLQIRAQARFGGTASASNDSVTAAPGIERQGVPWTRSPFALDQPTVILAGDLNSRIALPDSAVREHLSKGDLPHLLVADELNQRRDAGDVWAGWHEGIICFRPTYKYVKGEDSYVGSESVSVAAAAAAVALAAEEVEEAGGARLGVESNEGDGDKALAQDSFSRQQNSTKGDFVCQNGNEHGSVAVSLAELTDEDGAGPGALVAKIEVIVSNTSYNEAEQASSPSVQCVDGSDAVRCPHTSGNAAASKGVDADQSVAGIVDGTPAMLVSASDTNGTVEAAEIAASDGSRSAAFGPPDLSPMTPVRTLPATMSLRAPRQRTPAWTDRVLTRCLESERLRQLYYGRAEICVSDHKPVVAAFMWRVMEIDAQKVHSEIGKAQRALDIAANKGQPRCIITGNEHDVGKLSYNEVATRVSIITNTSEAMAQWLLSAPEASSLAGSQRRVLAQALPKWIRAEPMAGTLTPGQSAEITFQIGVANPAIFETADPTTAEHLVRRPGAQSCSLLHMLAVHVVGGADHFVAFDGTFVPSFFGLTVSTLADREKPDFDERQAFSFDTADYSLCNQKPPFLSAQWSMIPRQLQCLLHYLCRDECLRTHGLFADSFQMIRTESALNGMCGLDDAGADLAPVGRICAAIDESKAIPEPASPHEVAMTFLSYFKALPQPFFAPTVSQLIESSRPSPAEGASVLKRSIGGAAEWALLCCTVQLLKLLLKVQNDEQLGGHPDDEDVATLHMSLAACFAEAWFPPVGLANIERHASAEDYSNALNQAEEAAHKQALFVQMLLQ